MRAHDDLLRLREATGNIVFAQRISDVFHYAAEWREGTSHNPERWADWGEDNAYKEIAGWGHVGERLLCGLEYVATRWWESNEDRVNMSNTVRHETRDAAAPFGVSVWAAARTRREVEASLIVISLSWSDRALRQRVRLNWIPATGDAGDPTPS